MAAKAYVLALPMEMLQHIASCVTDSELLTLRLTCKELEAAAFDHFAEVYLSETACFVMDPDRVRRLLSIVSSTHFAPKVRKVRLTMCPFEEDRSFNLIQVVPHKDEDFRDQQHRQYHIICAEQAALHLHRTPNSPELRALLAVLKANGIKLVIDLASCAQRRSGHYLCCDVLEAAARTRCPIYAIKICTNGNARLHGLAHECNDALFESTRSLQRIQYGAFLDYLSLGEAE
ncbi:hypothetical protein LTR85_007282 [Meristemomyces frigidus]|nr:hypothetical protein LTR85_007282 [Meristemomyces frigidus]